MAAPAGTLLNIDVEGKLGLAADDLRGACMAVLGVRGTGKSNSAAVIVEELLPVMPVAIVDIEGEYWGLRERYDVLTVGRSANVDLGVAPENAGDVARFSAANGLSVILDVSEFDRPETEAFLLTYFTALWEATTAAPRPYLVVLEEAQEFVPQGKTSPLKELLVRIALRGRKRGLSILAVSQRSAKVDKDVLTQAGLLFLHRVGHPTDMAVYKDLIPLPGREVETLVRALKPGQAVAVRDDGFETVQIRARHTFHAGATPDLDAAAMPQLRAVDERLLADLRALLAHPAEETSGETEEATGKTHDLDGSHVLDRDYSPDRDALLREKDDLIERLTRELERVTEERDAALRDVSALKTQLAAQANENDTVHAPELDQAHPDDTAPEESPGPVRSELALSRAANRQRRRFDRFLADVRQEKKMHRDILAFLLDRDEKPLTVREIARRLGLSEQTILKNPPTWMFHEGLIGKNGGKGAMQAYRATARPILGETYPDLETDALVEELIGRLVA